MTRHTTAVPAGRAADAPRRAVAITLATLLALVLAACSGSGATPSPASSAGSRAEGLVVDVVSSGPVAVSRFTVRTVDGTEMEFDVGTLDVSAGGFPAEHLGEHRLAAEPVVVLYRDEGGRHVAFKLEDAEPAPS
jgi:hypothetical protein